MKQSRYLIITPVRNEQEYVQKNIDSVVAQTIRPVKWVIVDDGSTDATGKIVEEAQRRYPWIKVVHRHDRGFRRAGGGVMDAFFDGFKLVTDESWNFVVKLDGDVTFEPDYFERCFAHFSEDPRLGIAGGTICNPVGGVLCPESKTDPPFHVRGATKIYKYECWQAIGGLLKAAGWDTVDEVKANMLGWKTWTFPDILIVHHRLAGYAYGTWANWIKNGKASYFAGYVPAFMLAKCARRFFQKPYVIGAFGLLAGYFKEYLTNGLRVDDPALVRYFREQQMRRLLGRPSLWG